MGTCPDALYSSLLDDLRSLLGAERLIEISNSSSLWPGASLQEAACFSILKSFLKKYEVKNSETLDSRALLKFLHVNKSCGDWSLQLSTSWEEVLFGELRRAIYDFLTVDGYPVGDSLDQIFHYGRTGPGASIGARGGDFYTKMFASPLSCTNHGLYVAYRHYIRNFPEWANAELIRQAHYGEANVVAGNRLSFVPKNKDISRTICIEPSLNMFAQLGLGHIIERRLLSCYGISMADQPFKNRELARIGSLNDELVTIDLSSASDSISNRMLKAVLPSYFYDMLQFLRSHGSEIPGLGYTELNMVSTMGNGFTFPLQTMLFSAVVVASFRARGIKPRFPRGRDAGNWGVFGDDIICPKEISSDVLTLLRILGFTTNHDKTFVEGPFRESCGSDFFRGVNIRGVYVKRLATQQDRISVINQLNLFSTRTGIKLPRTVQRLMKTISWCPVPRWDNDDSGVKVPLSMVKDLPRVNFGSILYRRYEPVGLKIRISECSIWTPRSSKPRIYNPSGLFLSFLQRSVNSYSIGVRHDFKRYKRKRGIAPFWDAMPTVHPLAGWFNWQRWETAVYLNLFG